MPTYEYQCKKCGAVMDVFQSITARPLRRHECGACGAVRPVQRLLGTGGALIFKGSGFYTTDYRSESFKKAAKAETESSKPAADAADAKPSRKDSAGASQKSGSGGKSSST